MDTITWQSLNWIDYSIVAILALSVLISLFRGFLREVISLITWVVAVFFAFQYATKFSVYFKTWVSSSTVCYILAFIAIFLVILILGMIVSVIIKKLVNQSGMGVLDRLLGAFFGAARGILLVSVVLLFAQVSAVKNSPDLAHSQLAPHFNEIIKWIQGFLPMKPSPLKPGPLKPAP